MLVNPGEMITLSNLQYPFKKEQFSLRLLLSPGGELARLVMAGDELAKLVMMDVSQDVLP